MIRTMGKLELESAANYCFRLICELIYPGKLILWKIGYSFHLFTQTEIHGCGSGQTR